MGMDVDGARHHDLAACIETLVRAAIAGLRADPAIANPQICDLVAGMGWIDDPAAFDAGQQGCALSLDSAVLIISSARATDTAPLSRVACVRTSVPVAPK